MAINATQLLLTASYGLAPSRQASNHLFDTLSQIYAGTFDPTAVPPLASVLLDLTAIDESGQSAFDVLSAAYYSRNATLNRLASFYHDPSET